MVAICIPIEIVQTVVQASSSEYSLAGDLTANFWLNAVHGVFIYTLYYQVCILAPIDMAKVWMLRNNKKVIGIFFCILCGVAYSVQALFFEILIKYFVTTNETIRKLGNAGFMLFVVQDLMEMSCCIIAMAAIWKIVLEERREIQ